MKKAEIQLGGKYRAKVSGKLTTVRVDNIRCRTQQVYGRFDTTERQTIVYDVTNLATGRQTTFRSAARFRCSAGTAG